MHALVPRVLVLAILASLAACKESAAPPPTSGGEAGAEAADANGFSAPTTYTQAAQAAVAGALALGDPQDFEDANRGLVASDPNLIVPGPDGKPIWDPKALDFVQGDVEGSGMQFLSFLSLLERPDGLFPIVTP